MAAHSSTLAWKISWMEEPGRLQSMGSLRIRHDCTTSLSLFTFMHWRRKWHPTPVFLPGKSQGRVASWAAIYGVAQNRTWLKRLSNSSGMTKNQVLFIPLGQHNPKMCLEIWILPWGYKLCKKKKKIRNQKIGINWIK